ncbi:sigma-54 interaction domain-containing protein [Sinanaerobacter chloroacetimidivorans]|uniref:Sigma 54-interacting transcriptional regulator n=1 Tax=Sinanaerobacter chloroacetimidivorans TaxID=2818044 RepID=A0A8J7W152_9FIRM|nr:sigma 54-interacting transcriptional regulator [Sinanaerobacter chloroacetimidivorans]MBR0598902.1 sigma 54-interacting transcriptional regulator [Sinanaerobacter chloroacetimidivorans]
MVNFNGLFQNHYEELSEILNCIKVGIYITDGKGNTILLNDESCKTGGLTRDEVVGKNMRELEEMGFIKESCVLRTLNSGAEENMIQNLGDGGEIFVTGVPCCRNHKIEYVVCTERDITEMSILKDLLKEKEEREEKYEKEILYLRNKSLEMSGNIITEDQKMKYIVENALRAARHDTTILLTGESGTGKEVFANLIYKNSSRVGKPFIKINCAAIPENLLESEFFGYDKGAFTGADKDGKMGIFELADGGTLFLDEIGELPTHLQSKLLRCLQEKEIMRIGGQKSIPVDVRIIAATNANLKNAIEKGTFREDLYYRLNILPIELIPLRERKGDIEKLTYHFMDKYTKKYIVEKKITNEAIQALKKYHWPGNVRELENVIERIIISFDGIEITKFQVNRLLYGDSDNPKKIKILEGATYKQLMEEYERQILKEMMKKYKKASLISKKLDINKSTLSRRLAKYNIRDEEEVSKLKQI